MRRLVLAAVAVTALSSACHPLLPTSPGDGRYYPCGVVTEHGVTEYLDAYRERCGEQKDQAQDCAEDDPCWDCQTMGNRVCGATGTEAQR